MSFSGLKQELQRPGRPVRVAVYWLGCFILIAAALLSWRLVLTGPPGPRQNSMSRYLSPSGWQNGEWPRGRTLNFGGVERAPETVRFDFAEWDREDTFFGLPLVSSYTLIRISVATSSQAVDIHEAMWDALLWQDHFRQETWPFWPDGGHYTAMTQGRQRAAQWHAPGVVALLATAAALACLPIIAARTIQRRIAGRRTARGQCTKCGYAIASLGVGTNTVCPECGSPVTPAAAVCSNNG